MGMAPEGGSGTPDAELAELLVSHLCFENNHPSLWKFIQQSLCSGILFPLQVLSLLASRVIPNRKSQPEAYRLFLELFSRYAFSFNPAALSPSCKLKILSSIDSSLHLSQTYNVHVGELGQALVLSFFSIVIALVDSILDDCGFQMQSPGFSSLTFGAYDQHSLDIDSEEGTHDCKRNDYQEQLRRTNSLMAIDILARLTDSNKAMILLRAVHFNLPEKFKYLLQRLQYFESHETTSSELKSDNMWGKLSANIFRAVQFEYSLRKHQLLGMLVDVRSSKYRLLCSYGTGQLASWIPLDIYMENAMDGRQLPNKSSIDVLAQGIITLKVFNKATWEETFVAIWLSALRLVQRERDPLEGPVPHLDARLSVLLSIVPLSIAIVLGDDSKSYSSCLQESLSTGHVEMGYGYGTCGGNLESKKCGLVSSLQILGHFPSLICPPLSVTATANKAASKAATFVLNSKNVDDVSGAGIHADTSLKAVGNMKHLIVEACIARNLMDTSAYFWPGYVSTSIISLSESLPKKSPWSMLLEGAPFNDSLINSLADTPVSSLAEIEKLYYLALNGTEDERPAAAKILCGASLTRGWEFQENVVHCVVKLLSPPLPPSHSGSKSHLIDHVPMLSAILVGASTVENVHILSLHGVIPAVAASLMPICEAFGSLEPSLIDKSNARDEPSTYMVFSLAFLFLLRLWKFYRPPLEQCIVDRGGAGGSELSLEYLLLLYNNRITAAHGELKRNTKFFKSSDKPVYVDSFPKLRAWYCQNKSCIASTLSGLASGNPLHHVANSILSMIYSRMSRTGATWGNSSGSTGSGGSPINFCEDIYQKPLLPAWEILEALPYVLEAILTACAYGKVSSRDMVTGLIFLVDYLPASLAVIISYFSAEITRGIWKPVPMNGLDWPSPAPILQSVESEIKDILASVGVDAWSCSSDLGGTPLMLPLPMAALVSLTITFKLEKSLEYIHAVAGPALENCASGVPYPSMPIIGSLWAQKVRRWHDFIVVSCSRSVFRQNNKAVAQLLRSCFSSFLGAAGTSSFTLTTESSVNGLLGSTISANGTRRSVASGFLYLRSCRSILNVQYVNDVIVGLVVEYSRESTARFVEKDAHRLKFNGASLSQTAAMAKEAATLGASLLCVAGGLQLVQELYRETIPTWLLSSRDGKPDNGNAFSRIMEGYAMAYLSMLSGSIVWGVEAKSPSWAFYRRAKTVGAHMDFMAGVMEGNISLGCHPATWKAYVSCVVTLMVNFAPAWILEVKLETLRKLAYGLSGWHECELALSLLERGGTTAMGSLAEFINFVC